MGKNISMQQLKEQRMSPAEKFVLDTVKGVKAEQARPDGIVYWCKDGKLLVEQDFNGGHLWVSYKYIRSVLKEKYRLNDNEIIQLLTKLLYKYTNNGQLTIKV
jgi:hypothetical protein